jgi:tetratricopeptide (TPR) repeat protein
MKIKKVIPGLLLSLLLFSCARTSFIIPEFDTPLEQYIFAKNLKEEAVLKLLKKREAKKREKATLLAYKEVVRKFPDDLKITPLAKVDIADIYYKNKKYKTSVKLYERLLDSYPDQDGIVCKALYGAARAHDKLKNYKKAMEYYKTCSKLFENDKRPYIAVFGRQARQNYSKIRIK